VRIAAEYYRLGDIEPALRNAQKAVEEDSGSAQAHNVLATIYQRIEQNDLAEQHFREALSLAPQDAYVLTAWGNYLCARGRYAEAQQAFDKAISNPLFSAPWAAQTRAGICYRRAGNTASAESRLRQALTSNPRYAPALAEMARLDYDRARYKSARGYVERCFQAGGYTADMLLLAMRVERKLGSRKRARAYQDLLEKNYPDAPEVIFARD
jgi:type IV pilus assembly protein PilF